MVFISFACLSLSIHISAFFFFFSSSVVAFVLSTCSQSLFISLYLVFFSISRAFTDIVGLARDIGYTVHVHVPSAICVRMCAKSLLLENDNGCLRHSLL